MITTRLSGVLGNMMFQISVAYSVGFDNNDTDIFFNFNDAFYPHKTAHQYKDTIFRNIKEGIPKPDYRFKETFFHPTFLYESLWNLALFILLIVPTLFKGSLTILECSAKA